jgi:hypothetical protein
MVLIVTVVCRIHYVPCVDVDISCNINITDIVLVVIVVPDYIVFHVSVLIFLVMLTLLRFALSKGPNRIGVSPHLRTETDPVSETSCLFFFHFSCNY